MSGAISGLQSSHRGEWFSGFINHFCMKNRRKRQWCLIYEAVGSAVCWNGFHFVSAAQLEIIRRMILTVLFLCILMYVWDSLLSAGYHPKQRKKHILPGLQMYTANWCTCVLVWALQRVQKANENLMQGNFGGDFFFGCFFEFDFEPCEKEIAFWWQMYLWYEIRGLCSASKWEKQGGFFGIIAQNKKGSDWWDRIVKSILTAFEYLNNVFYTFGVVLGPVVWL